MKLMRFLNGGVAIEYLDSISIPEVFEMYNLALDIDKQEERLARG